MGTGEPWAMIGTCACDCSNVGGSFSHQVPSFQEARAMCTVCCAGDRAFGWNLSPEALAACAQLCACPYRQDVSTSPDRQRRSWMFLCLLPKHTAEVSLPLWSISKGQCGSVLFCRMIMIAVQKVVEPLYEQRGGAAQFIRAHEDFSFPFSIVRFSDLIFTARLYCESCLTSCKKEPNNTGLSGTC